MGGAGFKWLQQEHWRQRSSFVLPVFEAFSQSSKFSSFRTEVPKAETKLKHRPWVGQTWPRAERLELLSILHRCKSGNSHPGMNEAGFCQTFIHTSHILHHCLIASSFLLVVWKRMKQVLFAWAFFWQASFFNLPCDILDWSRLHQIELLLIRPWCAKLSFN